MRFRRGQLWTREKPVSCGLFFWFRVLKKFWIALAYTFVFYQEYV